MMDADVPAFMDTFRGVMAVFNIRRDSEVMADEYFKALRAFPLPQVVLGADRCKASLRRFPKPAEWRENIPKAQAPNLSSLNSIDAADYFEAESCAFEQPPCRCAECAAAKVFKPIRFVPDEGEPQAKLGDRIVTRGHWAHGWELSRWYTAHEAFWTQARAALGRSRKDGRRAKGPERLVLATAMREIGEEG